MDAGINNVIYVELYSGPKMADGTCRKTIVTGTIDRGSTVEGLLTFGIIIMALSRVPDCYHLQGEVTVSLLSVALIQYMHQFYI
jgi:hypothetical protein